MDFPFQKPPFSFLDFLDFFGFWIFFIKVYNKVLYIFLLFSKKKIIDTLKLD
jgi:hypothetical protein